MATEKAKTQERKDDLSLVRKKILADIQALVGDKIIEVKEPLLFANGDYGQEDIEELHPDGFIYSGGLDKDYTDLYTEDLIDVLEYLEKTK